MIDLTIKISLCRHAHTGIGYLKVLGTCYNENNYFDRHKYCVYIVMHQYMAMQSAILLGDDVNFL